MKLIKYSILFTVLFVIRSACAQHTPLIFLGESDSLFIARDNYEDFELVKSSYFESSFSSLLYGGTEHMAIDSVNGDWLYFTHTQSFNTSFRYHFLERVKLDGTSREILWNGLEYSNKASSTGGGSLVSISSVSYDFSKNICYFSVNTLTSSGNDIEQDFSDLILKLNLASQKLDTIKVGEYREIPVEGSTWQKYVGYQSYHNLALDTAQNYLYYRLQNPGYNYELKKLNLSSETEESLDLDLSGNLYLDQDNQIMYGYADAEIHSIDLETLDESSFYVGEVNLDLGLHFLYSEQKLYFYNSDQSRFLSINLDGTEQQEESNAPHTNNLANTSMFGLIRENFIMDEFNFYTFYISDIKIENRASLEYETIHTVYIFESYDQYEQQIQYSPSDERIYYARTMMGGKQIVGRKLDGSKPVIHNLEGGLHTRHEIQLFGRSIFYGNSGADIIEYNLNENKQIETGRFASSVGNTFYEINPSDKSDIIIFYRNIIVDWETKDIYYFTQTADDTYALVKTNKTDLYNTEKAEEVFFFGLDDPKHLYLNPKDNKIYWNNFGNSNYGFFSANLDGSDFLKLSDITFPKFAFLFESQAPEVSAQSFTVNENIPSGTVVGIIQATDNDGDQLSFAITSGNKDEAFTINESTGELAIFTESAINYETNPSFVLNVQVSDGELSSLADITVSLSDLNEPPVADDISFNVDENLAANTSIGTVSASDPENNDLTFSIVSGNDSGTFAIDQNTGGVTVANSEPLDYEVNPSFELTVEVSDGELSDDATITISVNDLDDDILDVSAKKLSHIKLYPNPIRDELHISGLLSQEVEILNVSGRTIRTSGTNPIDMKDLESGIYLLKLKDIRGNTHLKKIIKK